MLNDHKTKTEPMIRPPPFRALWEITARCDLRCDHCLVNGGYSRPGELTTEQALDLIDQLALLGTKAVTLTGGEPFLRKDWPLLAERIRARNMILRFSANGHFLDDNTIERLLELSCEQYAVSIDGLKETHDALRHGPRGQKGKSSFERVIAALDRLRTTPIISNVITAVTRHNSEELHEIHDLLKEHGTQVWMIQLAHKTGRLSKEKGHACQLTPLLPRQLPRLSEFLVKASEDPVLPPVVHNSIGYLSRDEPVLRSSGRSRKSIFWTGCKCGVSSIGIEPDGSIKGCANQIGNPFVVGNVKEEKLKTIWEDANRWRWLNPSSDRMSGQCAACALANVCHAGCTALSYSATGELFNNPYCLRNLGENRESN